MKSKQPIVAKSVEKPSSSTNIYYFTKEQHILTKTTRNSNVTCVIILPMLKDISVIIKSKSMIIEI